MLKISCIGTEDQFKKNYNIAHKIEKKLSYNK